MGFGAVLDEAIGTLIDFGYVASTRVLDAAKSVVARVVGDEDPDGDEDLDGAELFGQAPLLYRPQDPTDAGRCETMFVRWGDERVVIATKDRRFQVEPGVGEVRLVALGKDGARQAQVVLTADGTAIVEAVEVRIGASDASHTIGLGDAIKSHFDAQKSWLDEHTHGYVDSTAGPLLTSPPVSAYLTPPGTPNPSPNVPDVESRHKVEN